MIHQAQMYLAKNNKRIFIPAFVGVVLLLYLALSPHTNSSLNEYSISHSVQTNSNQPVLQDQPSQAEQNTLTENHNIDLPSSLDTLGSQSPSSRAASKYSVFSQLYASYQLPQDDLSEQFNEYLNLLVNDEQGDAHIKVSRILYACTKVPNTSESLLIAEKKLENDALLLGRSNGDILARQFNLRSRYADCRAINKVIPITKYYQYMEAAAELNNPVAMVELATWLPSPDFVHWDEQEKSKYRKKMGDYLYKARSQCELRAFQALAYPKNYGEDQRWTQTVTTGFSTAMEAYANLVVISSYMLDYLPGEDSLLQHQEKSVKARSRALSMYEVQQATAHGKDLYQRYCKS